MQPQNMIPTLLWLTWGFACRDEALVALAPHDGPAITLEQGDAEFVREDDLPPVLHRPVLNPPRPRFSPLPQPRVGVRLHFGYAPS